MIVNDLQKNKHFHKFPQTCRCTDFISAIMIMALLHFDVHTVFAGQLILKVANLSSPKEAKPIPKESRKIQVVIKHPHIKHACITKHKIDIKTHHKHRWNTILIFRSIFFPVITLTYICFLLNTLSVAGQQQNLCNILCTLHAASWSYS